MIESVDLASGPFDHEDLFSLIVLQSQNGLLVGRKQRGFARGKLVVPGGKDRYYIGQGAILLRPGHLDAAQELQEETGVSVHDSTLENRGWMTIVDEADGGETKTITLYAGHVDSGKVEIRDSAELQAIAWQPVSNLPYGEMPPDYQTWLPSVLAGYAISATIYTDGEMLLATDENWAYRHARDQSIRPEAIPVIAA